MKISTRHLGKTTIFDLSGDIDFVNSSEVRQSVLREIREAHTPRLVLNLRQVRYIDSSGIATLIEVLKDSKRLNKEFVLFGLSPAVEDVFRLTHVIRIFQVFQTEQEALGTV